MFDLERDECGGELRLPVLPDLRDDLATAAVVVLPGMAASIAWAPPLAWDLANAGVACYDSRLLCWTGAFLGRVLGT